MISMMQGQPPRCGSSASHRHSAVAYGFATIAVLGLLISMGALHNDPIAASLPGMAQELGCGANETARVISAFLLGMTAGQVFIGPVSDVIGRKRTILAGLSVLVAGGVVCALASSLPMLIAGRVIQGLGGATATCSARAIGSDSGDVVQSTRVLSLMQVISSATPIVIPLLGNGIARQFDWRAVFWFMAAVDGALLVCTRLLVPETAPPKKERVWQQLGSDVLAALKTPTFLLYTFAFGFGISTFYCYTSASSFALQNELGVTPVVYSRLLSCMGIIMVLTAMMSSRLPRRFGLVRSFAGTVAVQMVSAAVMSVLFLTGSATVSATVVCYALIAGGASISIPIGLSLAVSQSGAIKGTASALCGFIQCLCSWFITNLLSSVSENGSIGTTAGLAMCISSIIALLLCAVGTRLARRANPVRQ